MLNTSSLADTIDQVNQALFFGDEIPYEERQRIAEWITGRQGLPRSYRGLFAPTDQDFRSDIRLFTGEKVTSDAAMRHILGEEACRVLRLLKVDSNVVKNSLMKATEMFLSAIYQNYENEPIASGFYCCGTCTPAFWRHLTSGGLDRQVERLQAGMKYLKKHRDGSGKWKRFPFYWTLLALGDINLSSAEEEVRYAAPAIERSLKRNRTEEKYATRRRILMERLMEIV